MQTRRLLTLGITMSLAMSLARAETGKKGIEVIDLDPPPRTTNLPLDQEGSGAAQASEASSAKTSASAAERFAAIEAKKNERLDRIRSFFGKMKGDSREARAPERFTAQTYGRPLARVSRSVPPPDIVEPAEPPARPVQSRADLRTTSEGSYYKVGRGDTLAKIGKKFFGSAQKFYLIADANGLAPTDRIRVGQELIIPEDPDARAAAPKAARAAAASRGQGPAKTKEPRAAGRASASTAGDSRKPEGPSSAAPARGATGAEGKLDYASYDFKLYQVQAGDTFATVADKFYGGKGDPSLIKLYNNKKESLKAGEKILIPLPKADHPGKGG